MAEFDIFILKQRKKKFKVTNDIYVRDYEDLGILIQELFSKQLNASKKKRRKKGNE